MLIPGKPVPVPEVFCGSCGYQMCGGDGPKPPVGAVGVCPGCLLSVRIDGPFATRVDETKIPMRELAVLTEQRAKMKAARARALAGH